MDFGYDENGNPLKETEPMAMSASDSDASTTRASSVRSATSSDSALSDDVEIVVGNAVVTDLKQPLVISADVVINKQNTAHLLIEDQKNGSISDGSYLGLVASVKSRIRNIAVIGNIHSGKTSLVSTIMGSSCLTHPDDVARKISVKANLVSSLLCGEHFNKADVLMNIIDTPGHPDFVEEVSAGLRLVDAALLCVEAVEELTENAKRLTRQAVLEENIPVVLIITKIDRLILDLQLPPIDAYRKLRNIVDQVNNFISTCGRECFVSPEFGTVCFSSCHLDLFFSLETFAKKYADVYPTVPLSHLTKNFWGQKTFSKGSFHPMKKNPRAVPTFVAFILEPLYKIIAHSITGQGKAILAPSLNPLPRSPILAVQEAVIHFCGSPQGACLDSLLNILPDPTTRREWLLSLYGLATPRLSSVRIGCAISPIQITHSASQYGMARVVSGVLRVGDAVLAVDEFCDEATGPWFEAAITEILVKTPSGFVKVQAAHEGQVVLVSGIGMQRPGAHQAISAYPSAALALSEVEEEMDRIQLPPSKGVRPQVHVSVELQDPRQYSTFQQGLQVLQRCTPGLDILRDETGFFEVTGFGELHLDSAMHELRAVLCKDVDIRISTPYVTFCESVADNPMNSVLAIGGTEKVQIGCTSASLHRELTQRMECELINMLPTKDSDKMQLYTTLRQDYGWDILAAKSIVALGPDGTKGPSLLLDDLLDETSQGVVGRQWEDVYRGFRAATKSGPLCGETVRGVEIRLVTADIAQASGRFIQTAMQNAVRRSIIGANPRLMEPVLAVDITSTMSNLDTITDLLRNRRGSILSETPIGASSLTSIRALIPAMDSFGFETQLRVMTHGEAFPLFYLDHWDVVPGNPLDKSVKLGPITPAKGYQLARDFVLKTRYRKGLRQDIFETLYQTS